MRLPVDRQVHAAGDEVAGLLVRVGVAREDRSLAQTEFRHQGLVAVNQRLPLDTIRGRAVDRRGQLASTADRT